MGYCRSVDGWDIQVSHFPPDISSHRAIIAWTVEEWMKTWPCLRCFRQQKASHQYHIGKQFTMYLQSNLPMVWDWKSDTNNTNSGRRRANRSRTRPVDIDYATTAYNDTSSRRLAATHRESRNDDSKKLPNRQYLPERWRMDKFYITNESVMDGKSSTPLCRDSSEPRNSHQSSRFQAALTDHVKIGPVTGIEVFKLAGIWGLKYKYRHNQEIRGLGCEYHEELNTHDNFFPQRLTTHILKPCHQQSTSCGGDREHKKRVEIRPVSFKAAPNPKLVSIWFQSRVWKLISAKGGNHKGLWIRAHLQAHKDSTSWRSSWSWRNSTMGSCSDKHAKCWANSVLGQGRVDWCTWSFCWETQNGVLWGSKRNDYLHSCSTRSQSRCENQSNFIFFDKDTVALEGTHIPHGQLSSNSQSISETGLGHEEQVWEARDKLFVFSTNSARQRTIDWTGPVHEPRVVLYKQSYRTDHDCIWYFNLRRVQDANLVFHQSSSDAIIVYDNLRASALDKVVTFAGDVLFVRKTQTLTKPEATLGDRIDLAHIRQTWRTSNNERERCRSTSDL